jgi:hypothetical protein
MSLQEEAMQPILNPFASHIQWGKQGVLRRHERATATAASF